MDISGSSYHLYIFHSSYIPGHCEDILYMGNTDYIGKSCMTNTISVVALIALKLVNIAEKLLANKFK